MIQAEEIIRDFQRFYSEGRGYIPATSGETWTQSRQDELAKTNETVKKYGAQWIGKKVDDCSGAFVDAYRLHNMSIYHGSNRIAREYVMELLPVSKARAGCAAFKLRKPGEDGYQLPDEYKKGGSHYNGDLNDYYHIGLVDGDGKNVINAQSTSKGFTRTPLSQWHCAARLKAVAYDGNIDEGSEAPTDDEPLYRAKVASENGKPVNMRRNPSTASAVLHEVKNGEEVEVTDVLNGWSQIVYAGENGYMMSKFLIPLDTNDAETVSSCLADLEEAKRLADRLSEIIGDILKGCGAG